ncbi:MAG: ferredoxin-NADP reductase [Rickettsiales bacterium]|jgi:thioredoxin reductase (NADPH)|nr:ferredoxin-NADP reductase [Rickettsiales bacterium]
MTATHTTDITIIGAGPTGLFAVFEAGMLKLRCHVVDALDFTGGQCTALYPEKPIYDIPAHPAINGEDLIKNLEEQAAPFAPVYHLGQRVEKLDRSADGTITITTSSGNVIHSKAVIIAAGCGAFGPNRPPLEGIEAYEASGSVRYMVGKREEFRGKSIVIAGGGDSAVDWAISLAEVAKKLYVVHRRPKFRCAPESQTKLESLAAEGKIEMVVPYQLAGLGGNNGKLSSVVVNTLEGETKVLDADVLLPFFGLSMDLGPIADWDLAIEHKHLHVDPASLQTSVAGIYAIGDIIHYPGKLKLILNGFAEAAMACHHIHHTIFHPGETYHFEYSTTKGVPA